MSNVGFWICSDFDHESDSCRPRCVIQLTVLSSVEGPISSCYVLRVDNPLALSHNTQMSQVYFNLKQMEEKQKIVKTHQIITTVPFYWHPRKTVLGLSWNSPRSYTCWQPFSDRKMPLDQLKSTSTYVLFDHAVTSLFLFSYKNTPREQMLSRKVGMSRKQMIFLNTFFL